MNSKRFLAFVVLVLASAVGLPRLPVHGQEQARQSGLLRVAKATPGQYIVVLKDDAPDLDERLDSMAVELAGTYRGIARHVYKHALKGFSAQMTEASALALSRDPRVEYVEEDGEVSGAQTQPPTSWGLDRIDQRDAALDGAYTRTATGTGVNVYVIDSGIMTSHADFGGRAANVFDIDGGNGNDCNAHGTHVAGIIGGSTYGVARNVKLYGVRVLDCHNRGSNSDLIKGIDWVTANHVKPAVANLSLGAPKSEAVDDAVRAAIASGVHYVVSAGNENKDAGDYSPARVEQAITVGSIDPADRRAVDSNYGSVLDVFAPGVSITSCGLAGDTDAVMKSGTSMAAPHATGVVALMLEEYPDAAPHQLESLIRSSATRDVVIDPGEGSANRLLNSRFAGFAGLPERAFEGVFEIADCNTASGWAWDKNAPYSPIHVDIYVDGTKHATIWATQFRQDLRNRGIGNGYHGFTWTVPSNLAPGQHTVSVKFSGTTTDLSSSPKTITVVPKPVITDQPDALMVCLGGRADFSVTATGEGLHYEWFKDGKSLNVRSPKFTIVTVTANDLGEYWVDVYNGCGKVTSTSVKLSLKPAPVIIDQPDDVTVCPGHQAPFSVIANGATLRYQWYKDGRAIDNIRSPKFTIVSATTNDVGSYHVVVTDECSNSVTSRTVKLSLNTAPVFTTEPSDAAVCAGHQARFSVYASGEGVRYQWYKDGILLTGAAGPTLIVVSPRAADEGLYHAVAIDKCGRQTESRKARLSLGGAITITQQPVNVTACAGQSATFSVTATGGNLRYQWRKNGGNIAGADKSSFTIPSVSAGDAASYSVVVYNGCDTMKESAAAALTVNAAMTLSPSSLLIDSAGGSSSVGVRGVCSWTAESNAPWITITSLASGNGNGGITYLVARNTGPARIGTMIIAGQTFTVTQQAGANAGQNNAQFVPPQTVPVSLTPGQRFNVSIKMKNTGTTTWTTDATAGGYRLVSQAPVNNNTWGLREAPLPQSVAPGAEVNFNFTITAPAAPGTYRFEWAMMQWQFAFGGFSPAIEITVR